MFTTTIFNPVTGKDIIVTTSFVIPEEHYQGIIDAQNKANEFEQEVEARYGESK